METCCTLSTPILIDKQTNRLLQQLRYKSYHTFYEEKNKRKKESSLCVFFKVKRFHRITNQHSGNDNPAITDLNRVEKIEFFI